METDVEAETETGTEIQLQGIRDREIQKPSRDTERQCERT